MVKFLKGELSAIDILKIAMSKTYRTATTPFGSRPVRYAGRAVSWKGIKKLPNESLNDFINRLASLTKTGTFNGLKNAQAMVQEYISPNKGTPANKGVSLVRDNRTGMYKILPRPAAILMEKAGHGSIVESAPAVTIDMLEKVEAQG